MAYVVIDTATIAEIGHGDIADAYMSKVGERVVAAAKSMAPVRAVGSLGSRESIDFELGDDGDAYVNVSWAPEFYYLKFNELGDSRQPARPFLRPALSAGA